MKIIDSAVGTEAHRVMDGILWDIWDEWDLHPQGGRVDADEFIRVDYVSAMAEEKGAMMRMLGVLLAFNLMVASADASAPVPVIYTTDLYHPHDDPDDHFDLLTLFALRELDVKAIIIDTGPRGVGRPAIPALKQVMHLTGRNVPYATGLTKNLADATDTASTQPLEAQAGVDLVLRTLREAKQPVTIFTTGSLRDVVAAFNREPNLFRQNVARVYMVAGHSGGEHEWNVDMDPSAYVRMMRSGLPVYWVPCFGPDGYASFWKFKQGDVLATAPKAVRNFILYALAKTDPVAQEPVAALDADIAPDIANPFWAQERNMWCTGALLHAAGRPHPSFVFTEARIVIDDAGKTRLAQDDKGEHLHVFRVVEPDAYGPAMTQALKDLLGTYEK